MKYPKTGDFSFKKLGKDYLITNSSGNWCFLAEYDFKNLLAGRNGKIKSKKARHDLAKGGFINLNRKKLAELAGRYLSLNNSFLKGPSLFIMVLTLRCNHRCVYCHAGAEKEKAKGFDMSRQTAKKAVEIIFDSPAKSLGIEFQGGEPLLNWPVLEFIVRYAKRLAREKRKEVKISLVSNLTLLNKEKIKFLLAENIGICRSFDGSKKVHDANRKYLAGSSYGAVIKKTAEIKSCEFLRGKKEMRGKHGIFDAVLTVSRASLPFPKEIVDEYVKRGASHIFIRPLNPLGMGAKNVQTFGYSAEEYIIFWQKTMDYILSLNIRGKRFIERGSFYMLKKILKGEDPAYLELRSPCGAGIGQIAFDYDGKVYTCDEGRMAAKMGRGDFVLGAVDDNYESLIDNDVVKTMCLASCLDNQAGCSDCAYKPYCGTCPVINLMEYGTIFPQISNTDRCKIHKAMFDYFFLKARNEKYRKIFESWLEEFSGI